MTTTELENFKKVALWRLQDMTSDVDPKYEKVHQEIIERIKIARVSYVDAPNQSQKSDLFMPDRGCVLDGRTAASIAEASTIASLWRSYQI